TCSDAKADYGKEQHRRLESDVFSVEMLLLVLKAGGNYTQAKYQQDVAKYRAGDGCLYKVKQAGVDCDYGDNDFCGVSKGDIEERPYGGTVVGCQMLSRIAYQFCQRHEGDYGNCKQDKMIRAGKVKRNSYRGKYKQEIYG